MRDFADQPFAARRSPPQAGHIGAGASLIDEDQALGVQMGLALSPFGTCRGDVRPILLGRAYAFF